jgi:hypothetical protein
MTSGARSPNARTCLRVLTAARSGPSPKARARTVELAPSIITPDLILRFKTSMIWRVFIFWRSAKSGHLRHRVGGIYREHRASQGEPITTGPFALDTPSGAICIL